MPFDRPRELTDPKAMRALAHPVRLALLEALADAGTLTATEAGERVGESPANASFHLRQLAKYGYVVEAEGGTGRKRPWKLKHLGMRWTDVHDDQELAGAARALGQVTFDRALDRARRGLDERHAQPEAWRAVTGLNQMRLYLTPEEMKAMDDEILELLLTRFADRRAPSPDQPAGAERVEILTIAYRV
jgi:DNA-binding transcriptional ArsR family regulator